MYNRHPTLPIDVKYNIDEQLEINNKNDEPFVEVTFQAVLSTSLSIRGNVHANIKKSQLKQQRDYNPHQVSPTRPNIGDKVLVQNQKRQDRKGGKFSFKWLGPYVVKEITKSGFCTLANTDRKSLLKPYFTKLIRITLRWWKASAVFTEPQPELEEKPEDTKLEMYGDLKISRTSYPARLLR